MNIAVLVKQVPEDLGTVQVTEGRTLDRANARAVTDPVGKNALEAAVQLAEATGGTVTVITLGPAGAKAVLKECVSVGAQAGVHVSDGGLAGSDALTTARVLAAAIGRLGAIDLVIAGARSFDGGSAAVPAMVAELLDLPSVTAVTAIDSGDAPGALLCTRVLEDGHERVSLPLPSVISVDEYVNTPRYPSVKSKLAANKAVFEVLTAADLGIVPARHAAVIDITVPPVREPGVMITGDTVQDTADKLVAALAGAGVL
ncbi:electron transfer flavoprotein subunit beta/FixA family protein [Cellulomonas taurus]|uniref:electron transfer flavoprotein subunit beta/FixA family protein n=1 Tax=Cellulomonas taurus TaxID=2729175 RepID=UPI00145EB24F|nr:electron transfer flavoprotein subunit beta/FixA family protein [Cellulomonas taurus]